MLLMYLYSKNNAFIVLSNRCVFFAYYIHNTIPLLMKKRPSYRKFQPQLKRIEELEKKSSDFKRIYTEYELMSDELWDLENDEKNSIPDDFFNAIQLQADYLEEEIKNWLTNITPTDTEA